MKNYLKKSNYIKGLISGYPPSFNPVINNNKGFTEYIKEFKNKVVLIFKKSSNNFKSFINNSSEIIKETLLKIKG